MVVAVNLDRAYVAAVLHFPLGDLWGTLLLGLGQMRRYFRVMRRPAGRLTHAECTFSPTLSLIVVETDGTD